MDLCVARWPVHGKQTSQGQGISGQPAGMGTRGKMPIAAPAGESLTPDTSVQGSLCRDHPHWKPGPWGR